MKIVTRAPYRIEFAGGGTDIAEYYNKRPGFVFSAAIKKYVTCTLTEREDKKVTSNFPFIDSCAKYYGVEGIDLQLEYDIDHGSGLGGSSSSFVAICKAMSLYYHTKIAGKYYEVDVRNIYEDAITLEREICAMAGGVRDQIVSAVGGFVMMTMYF